MLESYGFKIGRITQVAGDCNGCVLGQFVKGKAIEAGTLIKKGTVIDLTIGKKDRFVSASTDTTKAEGTNFNDEEYKPNMKNISNFSPPSTQYKNSSLQNTNPNDRRKAPKEDKNRSSHRECFFQSPNTISQKRHYD